MTEELQGGKISPYSSVDTACLDRENMVSGGIWFVVVVGGYKGYIMEAEDREELEVESGVHCNHQSHTPSDLPDQSTLLSQGCQFPRECFQLPPNIQIHQPVEDTSHSNLRRQAPDH